MSVVEEGAAVEAGTGPTVRAQNIMTTPVWCAEEDWPVDRLAEFLIDRGISGAPVLDEAGNLTGVVSLTDLVRVEGLAGRVRADASHGFYLQHLEHDLSREDLATLSIDGSASLRVGDIMTRDVLAVWPNTPAREIASLMRSSRVHRVIVADHTGPVGIVSAMDLLALVE